MTWITGLVLALVILALGGAAWAAWRAGRSTERASARDGAADLRHHMDDVDAAPPADGAALDGWLRRGSGGD
ncbi:MAG: hypothetical protein PHS60_18290 [Zavarzinia sp.]|nr:hypothetical protein [Zavarzinia sp.]